MGDSYKSQDCSVSCVCEEAGAALKCEDTACQGNFVCGAVRGEPACVCSAPFVEFGASCECEYCID